MGLSLPNSLTTGRGQDCGTDLKLSYLATMPTEVCNSTNMRLAWILDASTVDG